MRCDPMLGVLALMLLLAMIGLPAPSQAQGMQAQRISADEWL